MRLSAAICFAIVLAGTAPLAAQSTTGNTATAPAAADQATGNTTPAATADAPAQTKPQKKKKTASAQRPKTAAAKAAKSDSGERPRSGAAVVKEGGKTCSGLDQYRVCW